MKINLEIEILDYRVEEKIRDAVVSNSSSMFSFGQLPFTVDLQHTPVQVTNMRLDTGHVPSLVHAYGYQPNGEVNMDAYMKPKIYFGQPPVSPPIDPMFFKNTDNGRIFIYNDTTGWLPLEGGLSPLNGVENKDDSMELEFIDYVAEDINLNDFKDGFEIISSMDYLLVKA